MQVAYHRRIKSCGLSYLITGTNLHPPPPLTPTSLSHLIPCLIHCHINHINAHIPTFSTSSKMSSQNKLPPTVLGVPVPVSTTRLQTSDLASQGPQNQGGAMNMSVRVVERTVNPIRLILVKKANLICNYRYISITYSITTTTRVHQFSNPTLSL